MQAEDAFDFIVEQLAGLNVVTDMQDNRAGVRHADIWMPSYSSHTDTAVRLYLQETFTFLLLTSEAAVALTPPAKAQAT